MSRSIEDEYKLANENLRLLGLAPVAPPSATTERERLTPIVVAYKEAMYSSPRSAEEFLQSRRVLPQIAHHIEEITKRLQGLTLTCEGCGEAYLLGQDAISLTSEEMGGMFTAVVGQLPTFLLVAHPKGPQPQQALDEAASTILRLGPERGWECEKCKHKNSWGAPASENDTIRCDGCSEVVEKRRTQKWMNGDSLCERCFDGRQKATQSPVAPPKPEPIAPPQEQPTTQGRKWWKVWK